MEHKDKPLFVIDNDPIVDWPVIVKLPVAGGTYEEYQFNASIRVLAPRDYDVLLAARKGEAQPGMSSVLADNVPIFRRLITGWTGVLDRDGNAVAFTPEKLAEQVTGPRGPALSAGLWRAISEVRFGMRLDDGTYKDGAAPGN